MCKSSDYANLFSLLERSEIEIWIQVQLSVFEAATQISGQGTKRSGMKKKLRETCGWKARSWFICLRMNLEAALNIMVFGILNGLLAVLVRYSTHRDFYRFKSISD